MSCHLFKDYQRKVNKGWFLPQITQKLHITSACFPYMERLVSLTLGRTPGVSLVNTGSLMLTACGILGASCQLGWDLLKWISWVVVIWPEEIILMVMDIYIFHSDSFYSKTTSLCVVHKIMRQGPHFNDWQQNSQEVMWFVEGPIAGEGLKCDCDLSVKPWSCPAALGQESRWWGGFPGSHGWSQWSRLLQLLLAAPFVTCKAIMGEVAHRSPVLQLCMWGRPGSQPQPLLLTPSNGGQIHQFHPI